MRDAKGYSLWELILTTAIVGGVLSIGLPSFTRLVADNRLRTEINGLFHAAHLARKESIFRRREVTLCPSADGEACEDGTDWSAGWIMFVNLDRDQPAVRDDQEPVLSRMIVHERVRIAANRRSFSFRTTERRATNGTLIVCDRAAAAPSRALVVSYTGRPRVARLDRHGEPYACPE